MSASAPMPPQKVFETLDAISRGRRLSDVESLALERAIAQIDQGRAPARLAHRPWQDHELQAVRAAARPAKRGRPRAGEESLAMPLAIALGRSPEAVKACMRRLRGADRDQLHLELP